MSKTRGATPALADLNGLAPRMEAAAVSLAGGHTLEQASKASGAGVTTIKTWTATVPGFAARVRELRAELTARVLARIASGMVTATETLERLCESGETERVRLEAAEAMLSHGNVALEIGELRDRVSVLERSNR